MPVASTKHGPQRGNQFGGEFGVVARAPTWRDVWRDHRLIDGRWLSSQFFPPDESRRANIVRRPMTGDLVANLYRRWFYICTRYR